MDAYGKSGSMFAAQLVFESSLATRDVISWNALMGGYSRQGDSHLVFELFAASQDEGLRPDNATLLCILSTCAHSGLVDKGNKYFQAMSSRFGLSPGYEHYVCMVDLLGRSNQLEQALALLRSMPMEPDVAAWRTLLAACEKWKNEKVGKIAFESAVRLGDNNAAAYTMMASIYESEDRRTEENS
ncbi:pentatricopeptide repeat-containing protein At4g02750-like [Selaginella moellendorffii]|uniref:pentatricopeptide repeat-containing protein At4g02750-like n=1 Tax=Selaginella moellendorffii TaxID=88036 RepID=UPI000D1CB24E|nr:pentatricopeptide repeat-containing protein At4g02750-like [Selaginella moellendorffii]|eukprot:XP_024535523.1 pentatricopeptide repeat-containing protein At4g02750-like [Selaginella moellendorffii]